MTVMYFLCVCARCVVRRKGQEGLCNIPALLSFYRRDSSVMLPCPVVSTNVWMSAGIQRWEVEVVEGKKKECIWVGSTEPKANLSRSNNGLNRVQRGGRLMASVISISQHKQLRAAAFVPLLSFLSSFGNSATMQVWVLLRQVESVLFAVRMSVVYTRQKGPNA